MILTPENKEDKCLLCAISGNLQTISEHISLLSFELMIKPNIPF